MNILFLEFDNVCSSLFSLRSPNMQTLKMAQICKENESIPIIIDPLSHKNWRSVIKKTVENNIAAIFIHSSFLLKYNIKELSKYSETKIFFYGPQTFIFPHYITSNFNYCGMLTHTGKNFTDLLKKLKNNETLDDIQGLFLKDSNRNFVPYYDCDVYRPAIQPHTKNYSLPVSCRKNIYYIELFSGCTKNCEHCSSMYASKYYYRSFSSEFKNKILQEIKENKNSYFVFTDRCITDSNEKIIFLKEIQNLNIKYTAQCCSITLNNNIIETLANTGCCEIVINIWNELDNDKIENICSSCDKLHIKYSLLFYSFEKNFNSFKIKSILKKLTPQRIFFMPFFNNTDSRQFQKEFICSDTHNLFTSYSFKKIKNILEQHNKFILSIIQDLPLKCGFNFYFRNILNFIKQLKCKYRL